MAGSSRSCSGVLLFVSNRRNASPNLPLTMFFVLLVSDDKLPSRACLDWELLRRCLCFSLGSPSIWRRKSTLDLMFLASESASESSIAFDVVRRISEGASKLRPGAYSRSRKKSKLDSTCMLAGRAFEFADLARSIVLPMSS